MLSEFPKRFTNGPLKLNVATVAPAHGDPVPWSTFVSALGALAARAAPLP